MRVPALAALIALATTAVGCKKEVASSRAPEPGQAGSPSIYVVNYPLEYFAERMAPSGTRVVFPVDEGVDPAFWKPSAEVIQEYQNATLILLNGAGYARWAGHATLPRARVVVTADGCRDQFLERKESARHQHGPEGAHTHSGRAFTTWLDLRLAACQAGHVRDALVERFPEDREGIVTRFEALEGDLLALDKRLRNVGQTLDGQTLLASHPVYAYLADAYRLSVESLHLEPEQVLSQQDWKDIEAMLAQHPSRWMLWEAPPLEATQAGLVARGVTPLVFDPAGQKPTEGDFITVMTANTERLECTTGMRACP
jgi:zinc transport system substrate-binding protein